MKRKFLRNSIIVVAVAAFLGVFYGLAYKNTPETDATVKATDFNAGRIIDDEVFYNANTMTVEEIQAHLDKYSASCDMWGEKAIGYGRSINGKAVDPTISRREYARLMREAGRSDYHDAPYVCISKYYENPTTHATNYDTNGEAQEGMISAAQIIYDAAQKYSINPQVLLVMLKKESYVWGDTWPLKNEYNTVMGYGCPDNAACDAKYYGFYNQVMKAAWQLNYYKEHIYSYGYYPYMTNNIYYSPNTSCGTKAVYLENIATTSLYIYTPYTPNDAALANYPGEAYCGSYGNRNFFMYFNEWFGSGYANWETLDTPVTMTIKQNTLTLNASDSSLTEEWNYIGQNNLYTSKKTILRNGESKECIRKASDEKSGNNTCVLAERLENYNPTITSFQETEYVTKQFTCEVKLASLSVNCEKWKNVGDLSNFNGYVVIDNVKYLVSGSDTGVGYIAERFHDESTIAKFESPKLVVANTTNTYKLANAQNDTQSYKTGDGVRATGEIIIAEKPYYIIKDGSDTVKLAAKDDFSENLISFLIPRDISIKSGSKEINLVTGEVCSITGSTSLAYFVSKVRLNNITYYQTKNSAGTNCVYNSSDLIEIANLYKKFIFPRYLSVKSNAETINIVTGEPCESSINGRHYFDLKIDLGGKTYYGSTGSSYYDTSACAIRSTSANEL